MRRHVTIALVAGLALGTPFGPFTSRNITPDEETGKPELTFAQFNEVLRKGTDFELGLKLGEELLAAVCH